MVFDTAALSDCFGIVANDNVRSTVAGLRMAGDDAGLNRPERLAQYLPQLAVEGGLWRYDREIWGPTPAQRRYEGRRDLGNTQPGDGERFKGRGPIQITGRYNYEKFLVWAWAIDPKAPDFVTQPDLVNTDPWEGLVAIWYWQEHNLNRYADQGDNEMVTRRINGGLNGYAERLRYYDQVAFWFLGRPKLREFQRRNGLVVDGVSGPKTRAALHAALSELPEVSFTKPVPKPSAAPLVALFEALGKLLAGLLRRENP